MARPLKYKTVEQLQEAIDAYFEGCEGTVLRDSEGNPVLNKWGSPVMIGQKPPTVTGLALALGFTSRQALLNYQGRKMFVDAVTRAKSRCEEYTESRLYDRDGAMGAKFSLMNNFKGWREKPVERIQENDVEDDPITKALKEEAENGVL